VFEVKIDKSHLSKQKKEYLNKLFLEAKWLYNYLLTFENVFDINTTQIKSVNVLNKHRKIETRELKVLSSQMKQSIHTRLIDNISSLSAKKHKGLGGVGKIKFKSIVNSIPLKQYQVTYRIKNQKHIHIQKFKKPFRVIGLKQLPENADITNATLIRKHGEYYFKITCFIEKTEKPKTNKHIGLDFGIKTSITDSNGNKYNFKFPIDNKIKKEQRRLSKKKLYSNNWKKQKVKLQKKHNDLFNKKKDTRNKFVSKIVKENDLICIQDEQLHNWAKSRMKGWGKRIQYSIMGGIISDLKTKSETLIIDRYFPSTKLCPNCKTLNNILLDCRIYTCNCGYIKDRDTHSAINILQEGLKQLGMEHTKTMPVENKTSFRTWISHDSAKREATLL
jgi:putative transposase